MGMVNNGIDWVDEIPKDWKICRIKDKYKLITGFTPDTTRDDFYDNDNGYTWVSIADMTNANGKISKSSMGISELYIRNKHPEIVKKGSLLYSFKLSVGKVGFAEKDLYTNEAIASFQNDDNVCLLFLYYAAFLIEQNANINIYGAKILNQDLIKNSITIVPPLLEQKAIAKYLDEKVRKIDDILSDIISQVKILKKYRNSIICETTSRGLDKCRQYQILDNKWYSEIPKEWKFMAIKRVTSILTCGVASTPEYVDEEDGVLFLSAQNVQDNRLDLSKKMYIPYSLHKYLTRNRKPQKGDILQVRVGATIGKSAVVDIDDEFSIYVSLTHIRVNEYMNNKFLNYVLGTEMFKEMASLDVDYAGSQGNLNVADLREIKIPVPPMSEQIEIVEFLDKKCSQIDEIIKDKSNQIEKMEGYKKSLIYEYITGKKRVKGVQ